MTAESQYEPNCGFCKQFHSSSERGFLNIAIWLLRCSLLVYFGHWWVVAKMFGVLFFVVVSHIDV